MHALLVGATGVTGRDLLDLMLTDPDFRQVDIFVRRDTGVQHKKLTQHVIEFDETRRWNPLVKGDVLFSCLGTTLKAARSKEHNGRSTVSTNSNSLKQAGETVLEVMCWSRQLPLYRVPSSTTSG